MNTVFKNNLLIKLIVSPKGKRREKEIKII